MRPRWRFPFPARRPPAACGQAGSSGRQAHRLLDRSSYCWQSCCFPKSMVGMTQQRACHRGSRLGDLSGGVGASGPRRAGRPRWRPPAPLPRWPGDAPGKRGGRVPWPALPARLRWGSAREVHRGRLACVSCPLRPGGVGQAIRMPAAPGGRGRVLAACICHGMGAAIRQIARARHGLSPSGVRAAQAGIDDQRMDGQHMQTCEVWMGGIHQDIPLLFGQGTGNEQGQRCARIDPFVSECADAR